MALVGNKNDLCQDKDISYEEAKAYAKEINAIFKTVSAATGEGIEDLFQSVGNKFLDPNWDINKKYNNDRKIKRKVLNSLMEYMSY